MKEQLTTTVKVSGKGETREKAIADALSRVQSTLLKASGKVLLRIEPQEVRVLQARESVRTERFLFFFLARERRSYSIELDVTVSVSAIEVDKINFLTC